jgi:hypothetical protein
MLGFNGALLGTMTIMLFIKNAGRKKENLTPSYSPSWPHPIIPLTEFKKQPFGECSLGGVVSLSSLRCPGTLCKKLRIWHLAENLSKKIAIPHS